MRRRLIIMVKEPRPGRVKTRLGRDIGMIDAAWWYRHQTARLLRGLRDPRWELVLGVAPDREGIMSRIWPRDVPRLPQGQGDLGRRMLGLLACARPGPVCLIGSDIPDVRRDRIWRAFELLGRHDAVFGPAEDGGYWLIGLKPGRRVLPDRFAGVRWSGPDALSDSVAALGDRSVGFADRLRDVDRAADLTVRQAGRLRRV